MRQDWLALWEVGDVEKLHRFTALSSEHIAHIHFTLELKRLGVEVPEKYRLERVGEPYSIREVVHGPH